MGNAVSKADQSFDIRFEADSAERLTARCNMRVGLWAGGQLGLPEESRAIYALEVMAAGMIDPGHEDVVDKIMRDFADRGIPITRGQILVQVSKNASSGKQVGDFGPILSCCLLLLMSLWACGQRTCVVHHVHSDEACFNPCIL